MFPISETIGTLGAKKKKRKMRGGRKTELPQQSWHLSVLTWSAALLLGEKLSVADVTAEHCPGRVSADSHAEAPSPAHFILSQGLTLDSNDSEFIPGG